MSQVSIVPKRSSPRSARPAQSGKLVEEPHELRSGKIGVDDESGPVADQVGEAKGPQLAAYVGRTPTLPYDCVIYRLASRPLPYDRRFALVRDSDRRNLIAFYCDASMAPLAAASWLPHISSGSCSTQPGLGKICVKGICLCPITTPRLVEENRSRRGRPLIQREDTTALSCGRL